MYHGGYEDAHSSVSNSREAYQGRQAGSRSATPRSEPRHSYPTYPQLPFTLSGESPEGDYEYEERDLGISRQSLPYGYRPGAGVLSGPPRSSYSAPSMPPNRAYSWDAYSQSSHGQAYAPSSAPPEYPPFPPDSFPGAYREQMPGCDDLHHPAAAPPSMSSSHTFLPYPSSAGHGSDAALFGVSAPHHHPGHHNTRQGEILPSFPQWSRTWYDGYMSSNGHAYTSIPPPRGGQSGWESETLDRSGASGPYGHPYGRRNTAEIVREERMRMLEKEFGKPKISHKGGRGKDDDVYDEERSEIGDDEPLPLGSVTNSGKLVTERPRWTMALRCCIGLVTLIGCICALGGAIFVKTDANNLPAPRGTFAQYILYGCWIVTLLIIIYLYVLRPCCCDPVKKEVKTSAANPLGNMIIPVLSGGGMPDGKNKGKRFGKKGYRGMPQPQQAPTVNLIVDPTLLGGMGRRDEDSDDEDDDDERLPGDARRSRKRKHGLGVLGNMKLQRRWQLARNNVKLLAIWDVILCIVWIACDVVTLGVGKKCSASAGTWCTLYNVAIACGVMLAVLLLVAIYFDYRDLRVSRQAPKPPM